MPPSRRMDAGSQHARRLRAAAVGGREESWRDSGHPAARRGNDSGREGATVKRKVSGPSVSAARVGRNDDGASKDGYPPARMAGAIIKSGVRELIKRRRPCWSDVVPWCSSSWAPRLRRGTSHLRSAWRATRNHAGASSFPRDRPWPRAAAAPRRASLAPPSGLCSDRRRGRDASRRRIGTSSATTSRRRG